MDHRSCPVSWGDHYLERLDLLGHGAPLRTVRLRACRAADLDCGALGNVAGALVGATCLGHIRRSRAATSSPSTVNGRCSCSASLLLSPLGWVYYVWIALWPVAASIGHAQPWRRRRLLDLLLVPGLAGWLWFGKMTEWGQPSPLATATFASMYFWALLSMWLWTVNISRRPSQTDQRLFPARLSRKSALRTGVASPQNLNAESDSHLAAGGRRRGRAGNTDAAAWSDHHLVARSLADCHGRRHRPGRRRDLALPARAAEREGTDRAPRLVAARDRPRRRDLLDAAIERRIAAANGLGTVLAAARQAARRRKRSAPSASSISCRPPAKPIDLVLRVANDGLAFRYRFPDRSATPHCVKDELTGFTVASGSHGWLLPHQQAGKWSPAYEDLFSEVEAGTTSPNAAGWSYPALFRLPDAHHWILITEAGLDPTYCGTRLRAEAPGGTYRVRLPDAGRRPRHRRRRALVHAAVDHALARDHRRRRSGADRRIDAGDGSQRADDDDRPDLGSPRARRRTAGGRTTTRRRRRTCSIASSIWQRR